MICFLFFFNDTATTEIYTLSLHDALPISAGAAGRVPDDHRAGVVVGVGSHGECGDLGGVVVVRVAGRPAGVVADRVEVAGVDRKSTRLNSSHANISYAVFCLKKKKLHIFS